MRKARLAVHHRSACSGVKALRNTSPARRQAAKLCYRFGPLTPSARSANLIAGDGTKNGLSRSEQKTVSTTQNNRLTGKAPYRFESGSLEGRVCEPSVPRRRSMGFLSPFHHRARLIHCAERQARAVHAEVNALTRCWAERQKPTARQRLAWRQWPTERGRGRRHSGAISRRDTAAMGPNSAFPTPQPRSDSYRLARRDARGLFVRLFL